MSAFTNRSVNGYLQVAPRSEPLLLLGLFVLELFNRRIGDGAF